MVRPLRIHIPRVPCHVVSRGNAKQRIFIGGFDSHRFLALLEQYLERFGMECVSYCLIWNHVHLLLIPHLHPISRLMQQLNSCLHAERDWIGVRTSRWDDLVVGKAV